MSSKIEEKHITNDTWKFKGYRGVKENEIRQKEKKKIANRRKNKRR